MYSAVHKCKIHCHALEPGKMEMMGIENDPGKWLPFAFHLDCAVSCKMTTDEEDDPVFDCTTVFTNTGDIYIIDTPYHEFEEIFIWWSNKKANGETPGDSAKKDLNF